MGVSESRRGYLLGVLMISEPYGLYSGSFVFVKPPHGIASDWFKKCRRNGLGPSMAAQLKQE